MYIGAIDIGGSKTIAGIVNENGELLIEKQIVTEKSDCAAHFNRCAALLLEAAAVCGCLFYRSFAGLLPAALSVFCLVCAYIVFCAGAYCLNMLARVELGFAGLLRNSFALVFMCPRPLFTWLLLAFILPLAGAFLLPHSVPLLALLLISASGLAAARGTLPAVCEFVERK